MTSIHWLPNDLNILFITLSDLFNLDIFIYIYSQENQETKLKK